jgi:hypothetical protein
MAAALRDLQGLVHKQRTVEVGLARCAKVERVGTLKVGRSLAAMPGLKDLYSPDGTCWEIAGQVELCCWRGPSITGDKRASSAIVGHIAVPVSDLCRFRTGKSRRESDDRN